MSAELGHVATDSRRVPRAALVLDVPSLPSRLAGLGSTFGRTIRDSRLAILAVGMLVGLVLLEGGQVMATTYGTPEARAQLATYAANMPPALRGLYGSPAGVDTLGGFVAWHYTGMMSLVVGLWSILALSSTLAGEAARGSLDLIAATPLGRRRLGLEKVLGHVVGLAIAMSIAGLGVWTSGAAFAVFPGDAVAPLAAVGFAVGLGVRALVGGALAFALAGFIGRAGAAGIAGGLMLLGYIANGYQAAVPAFAPVARLSWFSWLSGHAPLGGQYDWVAVGLTATLAVALLVVGIEVFARADIGVVRTIRLPRLPAALLGLRGPFDRSLAERGPLALAWGVLIGALGLMMAASSRSFADEITKLPDLVAMIKVFFPTVDILSPAGFLQLVFAEFGFVLVGLAAATLVGGWASDETSGRLELLLATPLTRRRWATAGLLGVCVTVVLTTLVSAAGIAGGAAAAGGDAVTPMLGTFTLALYGLALVGVGAAVTGLGRAALAGPVVAVLVVAMLLDDMLGAALDLPTAIRDLSLGAHLGQPMVGTWDVGGMLLCASIAIIGIALGTWGVGRRDIAR